MKVITIKQPWASLIVSGYKKIETRSWNTKYRGELLIHASKADKHMKQTISELYEYMNNRVYIEWHDKTLPFGKIIGKVNLIETISTEELHSNQSISDGYKNEWTIHEEFGGDDELAFGDYSPNRFGWLLSDPVKFENPIEAKGQLGLWNFDIAEK